MLLDGLSPRGSRLLAFQILNISFGLPCGRAFLLPPDLAGGCPELQASGDLNDAGGSTKPSDNASRFMPRSQYYPGRVVFRPGSAAHVES